MPRYSTKERQVVLLGGGLSKFASDRADGSIRDWVAEAVLEALADAGLERDQIQHAVTSYESDHFANQLTQGAIFHDVVGLCPKPNVRVEGGGATGGLAIRTAYAYLKAGLCDCILVSGAESCGKRVTSQTAQEIFAMSADTDWDMLVGGHFTAYYAMMIQEHMRLYGTTEEQLALVAVKNHHNAHYHPLAQKPLDLTVADVLASPVIAAPYKLYDCSLLTDGAAALILANAHWARKNVPRFKERPAVYLAGTGCGTDFMRLGDRPRPYPGLAHLRAKRQAAQEAYTMSNVTDPRRQIQVAEVYDAYTGAELMSYEALGFCAPGESGPELAAGVFDLGGELPTNPSGGLLGFGAPAGATGIAQAIEILRQLQGEADPRRQVPGARRGLSECHGGTATIAVVHVFERRD